MAAPTGTYPYAHDLFGNFQIGLPRVPPADETIQQSPTYYQPRSETEDDQPLDVASLALPITEIEATALRPLRCMYCRGKRYDFSAYFHNTKIFPEPPHELLRLVEESYVQKNRLQSLLINYGLRETQEDSNEQIQKDLQAWEMQVYNLAMSIGEDEVLARVQSWASSMMRQLWEHVVGMQKLDLPPGRAKQLCSEFRKLWEAVWVRSCSLEDSASRGDTLSN